MGLGSPDYQVTRTVVLVPTKELALQVSRFLKKLTVYCEGVVGLCNVSTGGATIQRFVHYLALHLLRTDKLAVCC